MQTIKTGPEQRQLGMSAGVPFRAGPRKPLLIKAMITHAPLGASRPTAFWPTISLLFSRVAQSFRLMVGVQDYQAYVAHMLLHHPEQPVMTEKQFHRYCVDARYGGKAGKLNKCPC